MKRRVAVARIAAVLLSAASAGAGTQLYPDFGPDFATQWHTDGRVQQIVDGNQPEIS